MKREIWIILLITLSIMTGCTNEEKDKIDQTKEVSLEHKEVETTLVEAELLKEPVILEKEKVQTDNHIVDEKAPIESEQIKEEKPPAKGNKKAIEKEGKQVKEEPTVKTDKVTDKKVDKETPTIPKTGMSTIDLRLPQNNSEERTTPITNLVVHFTSNAALKPTNPYDAQDIHKIFIDYGVSAHYMIGREGEIYLLVPEDRVAYHAGKGSLTNFPAYKDQLNKYSIGIEMMAIGTKEEMVSMVPATVYDKIPQSEIGFTEAQYKSLHSLINDIVERNPTIKRDRNHIVGHDEYAPNRKTDPGSLFNWSKVGF